MSQIGEPVRKVEYAPLEDPVPPKQSPKEEPTRAPERKNPEPVKIPEKDPAPA